MISKPREDLSDIPPDNPDLLLFCDGSCKQNFQGNIITDCAIISPHKTMEAYSLLTVNKPKWKSHGFLPSADTPIANGLIIADLLKVIHLLSKSTIIHYSSY